MIDITNLTRDYGHDKGVFDLSLHIDQGEVFGFIGPNGAGKTTTIRHLMGFLFPEKGTCTINGMNCWKYAPKIQKNLGYIAGEISFFDDMTGPQFIKFLEKYRKVQNSRADELIKRFDLDPQGKIKKMSKGMKQKIGIVTAFMHNPDIIILDEPSSGLDPLMQNRFIELIQEEKEKGKTILMSSHIFEEVERTCHRVGIIKNGHIIAMDTVANLKAMQTKKYVVTFQHHEGADSFMSEPLEMQRLSNHRIEVTIKNNLPQFLQILTKHPIVNLDAPSQGLEDIFMGFYGGEQNV